MTDSRRTDSIIDLLIVYTINTCMLTRSVVLFVNVRTVSNQSIPGSAIEIMTILAVVSYVIAGAPGADHVHLIARFVSEYLDLHLARRALTSKCVPYSGAASRS